MALYEVGENLGLSISEEQQTNRLMHVGNTINVEVVSI